MQNPFEEIITKLDELITICNRILLLLGNPVKQKIPFKEFCKEYEISRPTAYAWHDKGLIKIEKIGGRNYVLIDSISVTKKYQRKNEP